MVPFGQKYVPSGGFSLRGLLTAIILGGWGAAISAGLICLWEISPIPTLMILTPIIQGFLAAFALAFVIPKMKIRNPFLAGAIGLGCGVFSVFLQHYGHYVHSVYQARDEIREATRSNPKIGAEGHRILEEQLNNHPFQAVDKWLLVPETGSSGLLGSMKLRAQAGVKTLRHNGSITGGGMWALWGVEALVIGAMATAGAASTASKPFCEDCHRWCEPRPGAGGELAANLADPLAEALRDDNPARVRTLKSKPPASVATVLGTTHVTVQGCPSCDLSYADVVLKVPRNKKEVKEHKKATHVRVSPEMTAVLLSAPGPLELDEADLIDDEGAV